MPFLHKLLSGVRILYAGTVLVLIGIDLKVTEFRSFIFAPIYLICISHKNEGVERMKQQHRLFVNK